MLKPNGLDEISLREADELIKGEISLEEYINKRGMAPILKMPEIEYLLVNSHKFNLFLDKLSIGCRCIVMKSIFKLKDRQIAEITGFTKSTISDFISENLTTVSKRNFSDSLVFNLAIVFDLPYKYLKFDKINDKMSNSFDEFELESIKIYNLEDLIKFSIQKMSQLPNEKRNIFGVRVPREFFNCESNNINTRVDIREKWFTLEFFIKNEFSLNYSKIKNLLSIPGVTINIYLGNSFLRNVKKLSILFSIEESLINSDFKYLGQRIILPY